MPSQTILPRWRGFNLLNFYTPRSDMNFNEDHFKWIAEFGFNYVRIPTDYHLWIEGNDVYKIKESSLEKLDRAVELAKKYNLHISLNIHRAPGYCINKGIEEPFDLWKDEEALKAFCYHWEMFAKRYSGISPKDLSFDLVNEPPVPSEEVMTVADYERVVRTAVQSIRNISPERLIMAEGISVGNEPCHGLADLNIAQSCRAYIPMGVSHYKASWAGGDNWPLPTWPGALHDEQPWDRNKLEQHFEKWAELARKGVGVHCGEGGAYIHTPHDVFLRWFRDVLEILTYHNIGYALWQFSGDFGIMNSNRKDVDYEDWNGQKLDRKLLSLLQEF